MTRDERQQDSRHHGDEREHTHHFKQGEAAFRGRYSFLALARLSIEMSAASPLPPSWPSDP